MRHAKRMIIAHLPLGAGASSGTPLPPVRAPMPPQRKPASDDASDDLYVGARRRLVEWVSGRPRRRLFTAAEGSPVRTLGTRLALVLVLLAVVIATYWFDRDGLRDQIDGE